MGEDRHRHKPKAVRLSGELLEWLSDQAAAEGRKRNAVIVSALEEYRANHGAEIEPAQPQNRAPLPQLGYAPSFPESRGERAPCRHPAAAVDGGVCQECGEDVW